MRTNAPRRSNSSGATPGINFVRNSDTTGDGAIQLVDYNWHSAVRGGRLALINAGYLRHSALDKQVLP
jgi:hypothetical protein